MTQTSKPEKRLCNSASCGLLATKHQEFFSFHFQPLNFVNDLAERYLSHQSLCFRSISLKLEVSTASSFLTCDNIAHLDSTGLAASSSASQRSTSFTCYFTVYIMTPKLSISIPVDNSVQRDIVFAEANCMADIQKGLLLQNGIL